MKLPFILSIIFLVSCSTGEKATSTTDSTGTATPEPTLEATTPASTSASTITEPDPVVSATSPEKDTEQALLDACPTGKYEIDPERAEWGDSTLTGADTLYNMLVHYGLLQGEFSYVSLIDNILDTDHLEQPRKLLGAIIVTTTTDSSAYYYGGRRIVVNNIPTLAIFDRTNGLKIITHCSLTPFDEATEGVSESAEIDGVELVTKQFAVRLVYKKRGFQDIDNPVESTTENWYALVRNQVVEIFSYTPHAFEHSSAGDGENVSENGEDITLDLKNLFPNKMRLLELETAGKESSEGEYPDDGIYSFNGVYYSKAK